MGTYNFQRIRHYGDRCLCAIRSNKITLELTMKKQVLKGEKMKTARMLTIPRLRSGCRAILVLAFGLMFCQARAIAAVPMGTAFTYQGQLYDANYAANGLYDFAFKVYDANVGGDKVGADVNIADKDVIDGYFTVELDFGSSVFDGNACWLEIGVRPGDLNDPNVYATLSPRQEVTPTPYAVYAAAVPPATAGGTVPKGGIIMWSGSIANIPSGWALCDGDNSTPDLRDKFIVAAKEDEGGVAKTNITGSLTQSGGDTSHDHGGATGSAGGEHLFAGGGLTGRTPSHTHSISSDEHIPPYYALAFIMKL